LRPSVIFEFFGSVNCAMVCVPFRA
jgi:hypothetical protein